MKASEQYFCVELFVTLHKVVLTMHETLVRDHSNESYSAVLKPKVLLFAVRAGSE